MMETKAEAFVSKHQLIKKHTTVIVGVSGGPDSVALLHFLLQRKATYHLKLIAVSVDHQLRGEESVADIEYVQQLCKKWDVPFEARQIDVAAYKKTHKVGTQLAARTLRYEVFEEMMIQYEADYLALGHHGDDQIETMLMGMMRTTTLQGLKGIPYRRVIAKGEIVRPLLAVTKAEIEAYCVAHHINPRIDPSNAEIDYTRNELRLQVVPILQKKNHLLHKTVQQLSETIQEDEQYLLDQASKLIGDAVELMKHTLHATIAINRLLQHPVSLQRRVFRLTLNYLYKLGVPENISYTHEQIFLQLLRENTSNKVIHFPEKLLVEKSYDVIQLYFPQEHVDDKPYHGLIQQVPSRVVLPNHDVLIVRKTDHVEVTNRRADFFTYPEAALHFPLHIRHRKNGDRMAYEGLQGSKKLKDIFIDDKVPRKKRNDTYVITDNQDDILWLVGMRKKAIEPNAHGPYVLFEYVKSDIKGES